MPVGLERRNTMADTERKKRKKPFMADYVERIRKKEEAAKKAKKEDKKDKTKKKNFKVEDLTERELDIGSDRDTKTIAERWGSISDISDKGRSELLYDMTKRGLELTNAERRRRGLPQLGKDPVNYRGPGKKSGGKVYSRGSRKAKYKV